MIVGYESECVFEKTGGMTYGKQFQDESIYLVIVTRYQYFLNLIHLISTQYQLMNQTLQSPSDSLSHQQSLPHIPSNQSLIKPWFYKPKKAIFRLEENVVQDKKFNSFHWTEQQNKKYVQFLSKFIQLVNGDISQKRKYHLNRMMSKYIRSRSPVQCRSHHQKMLKAFKTNEAIISNFVFQSHQTLGEAVDITRSEEISEEPTIRPGFQEIMLIQKCQEKMSGQPNHASQSVNMWDILSFPVLQQEYLDY